YVRGSPVRMTDPTGSAGEDEVAKKAAQAAAKRTAQEAAKKAGHTALAEGAKKGLQTGGEATVRRVLGQLTAKQAAVVAEYAGGATAAEAGAGLTAAGLGGAAAVGTVGGLAGYGALVAADEAWTLPVGEGVFSGSAQGW